MMLPRQAENFLYPIYQAHLENAQTVYSARGASARDSRSVSPLTNFVFEYFLYNSLYAVDWAATLAEGDLVLHSRNADMNEMKQQTAFLKFCRDQLKASESPRLSEAFQPLARLEDLSGEWTIVTSGTRVSAADGERLFRKVKEIGDLAAKGELRPSKGHFDLIGDCCHLIYLVRNNIFHGSKTIGQVHDPEQLRRIAVYDVFIRCVNSLFFITCGKAKHGGTYVQWPIRQNQGGTDLYIETADVLVMINNRVLKPEDSHLHGSLKQCGCLAATVTSESRTALFYPSAGDDLFFPILVGLPSCTDFYFYSESFSNIRRIGLALRKVGMGTLSMTEESENRRCYRFEFADVDRRLWLMRQDNLTFLETDIPVAFYFHRGDSNGEGGSDQAWDGDLFPQLLARRPPGQGLRVLTDGIPHGLHPVLQSRLHRVTPPHSHRDRDYYLGVIEGGAELA